MIPAAPVVVAVDESDHAMDAVRWATHEAILLDRDLQIVAIVEDRRSHRTSWSFPPDRADDPQRFVGIRLAAAAVIARGEAERAGAHDCGIDADLVFGVRHDGWVHAAHRSDVFVIGSDATGELLEGSTVAQILPRVDGPIVIVHGVYQPAGPGSGGEVVVGVDGFPASEGAVARAFFEADRRGAVLHAVHIGGPGLASSAFEASDARGFHESSDRAVLAEQLAGYCEDFPDVRVMMTVVRGDPVISLAQLSMRARLVIVGSRRHRGATGVVFGSMSERLVGRMGCPLMVVRPEHASSFAAQRSSTGNGASARAGTSLVDRSS